MPEREKYEFIDVSSIIYCQAEGRDREKLSIGKAMKEMLMARLGLK